MNSTSSNTSNSTSSSGQAVSYGAVISLGQLNVTVIAIVCLLVLLVAVLSLAKVRRIWAEDVPTHGRGVAGVGSRGLDSARIQEVSKAYEYASVKLSGGTEGEDEEEGLDRSGRECPVCLAEYKDGDELRRLNACGHTFHQECIDAWLKNNCSCPLCRTSLRPEEPPQQEDGSEVVPSENGPADSPESAPVDTNGTVPAEISHVRSPHVLVTIPELSRLDVPGDSHPGDVTPVKGPELV